MSGPKPPPRIVATIYEVETTPTGLLANVSVSADHDVSVLLGLPIPAAVAFGDRATQDRWLAALPAVQSASAANEP